MFKYQVGQVYIYSHTNGLSYRIYKVTHVESCMIRGIVLDSSHDYLSSYTSFAIGSFVDTYSRLYININKELENI